MVSPTTLTTAISAIAISEVETAKERLLTLHFNEIEIQELSTRHIRSTAGYLVLKKALCKLFSQVHHTILSEKDFLIKRTDKGRPYIHNIALPNLDMAEINKNLFVSISHTRATAYGMAVYQI